MAKVNLQGLIDEVLNMAKERQAMETGSDRGTNAWNAREVDKINSRNRKNWDEEDSQNRLGKQAMDLQGLKNTGITDAHNIMESGATARQKLSDTSKEGIASQGQMTSLMGMRATSADAVGANKSHENVAQISGDSLVKAAQVKTDVLGEPGKTLPPVATSTPATNLGTSGSPIAPAPENPINPARAALGATPPAPESDEDYAKRYKGRESAAGINLGMVSPANRTKALNYDKSSREQLAKSNTSEAMAADEERKKRNRERLGMKD